MNPQAGPPVAGQRLPGPPEQDTFSDYRRLTVALATRARRLGSRDPETAAQEAVRRSLESPKSQPAVEYYFGELPGNAPGAEWPLDQLFGWLHGMLQFVVREQQNRVSFRREISALSISDLAESSPDALNALVERETTAIIAACFTTLDRDYRDVLSCASKG